jgi:hypothetical protein
VLTAPGLVFLSLPTDQKQNMRDKTLEEIIWEYVYDCVNESVWCDIDEFVLNPVLNSTRVSVCNSVCNHIQNKT